MSATGSTGRLLQVLIEDPTKSTSEIAKESNSYRQRILRNRKTLEEDRVIWGYTAVIDEIKLGHVSYMVLMRTKPLSKELLDRMVVDVLCKRAQEDGIRVMNVMLLLGDYDWILRFTAPDNQSARRFFEGLRVVMDPHLSEKPRLVNICFSLIQEGKMNPGLESIYDLLPEK